MAKRLKRWALATSIVAGLVFVLAGTLRDVWLWAYVGVWTAASAYALLGMDEELAKERFRPPTAGADGVAMGFLRLFALSHLVVGALDAGRWHLTPAVPSFHFWEKDGHSLILPSASAIAVRSDISVRKMSKPE